MPINDPGNAGTASRDTVNGHDDIMSPEYARKRNLLHADRDRRRRVNALALAILSGLALLPSIFLAAFISWSWLLVGFGTWLVGMMVISGITTYLYGRE